MDGSTFVSLPSLSIVLETIDRRLIVIMHDDQMQHGNLEYVIHGILYRDTDGKSSA